jgi:hypothetical protein
MGIGRLADAHAFLIVFDLSNEWRARFVSLREPKLGPSHGAF